MADQSGTDLQEVIRHNGAFKRHYGRFLGAYLYLSLFAECSAPSIFSLDPVVCCCDLRRTSVATAILAITPLASASPTARAVRLHRSIQVTS